MKSLSLEGRDFIPLCDLLKRMGFCESGGHAKAEIAAGLVRVNGKVELRKRCKIVSGDQVQYMDNDCVVCP